MSESYNKKLLVAIDGSKRSIDTVNYISEMPFLHHFQIDLFHVFANVPQMYWDLQKEASALSNISQLYAWESQNKKNMLEHMEYCKGILLSSKMNEKNVNLYINNRKKTVAFDIMRKAEKGYFALMMRRRGMTNLKKMVMGSTAQKILDVFVQKPIIFAGKGSPGNKILIAFDGSENAMRAVDCACEILDPGINELILAYVSRKILKDVEDEESSRFFDAFKENISQDYNRRIDEALSRLYAAGFNSQTVKTEFIRDADGRAQAIVNLAETKNAGTIFAGRRGHTNYDTFTLGRVARKIIQLVSNRSVWIIN